MISTIFTSIKFFLLLFFASKMNAQQHTQVNVPSTKEFCVVYAYPASGTVAAIPTDTSQRLRMKDYAIYYYSSVKFSKYNSSKNDGNITGGLFWADPNGILKRSPVSSLTLPLSYSAGILGIGASTLSMPQAAPQTSVFPMYGVNVSGSAPTFSTGIDTTKVMTVFMANSAIGSINSNLSSKQDTSNSYTKSQSNSKFMPAGYVPPSAPNPTLSMAGNILSIYPSGSNVVIPQQDLTQLTPKNTDLTINGVTYDLSASRSWSIPPTPPLSLSVTTSAGTASATSLGTSSVSINIPPAPAAVQTSLTGTGAAVITGTGQAFTVFVPTQTAAPSPTITGGGVAIVTSSAANAYSVYVPAYTQSVQPAQTLSLSGQSLSISGGNTVTLPIVAVPSLAISGNTLSIVGSNTVSLHVTDLSAYSTKAQADLLYKPIGYTAPAYSVTAGANMSVQTTGTTTFAVINTAPHITSTITAGGIATASMTAPNVFSLGVPAPAYTPSTGALTTGTSVINITPSLSVNGNTLTAGPLSNSVVLPLPYAPTIYTIASRPVNSNTFQVSNKAATVNYVVNIKCQTIAGLSGLTTTGGTLVVQYSTDNGVTWNQAGQASNELGTSIISTDNATQTIPCEIPANAIVRMVPTIVNATLLGITVGNTTITFIRGQEKY